MEELGTTVGVRKKEDYVADEKKRGEEMAVRGNGR